MNIVRLVSHFPARQKIHYGLESTFYNLSREQVNLGLNVHIICRGYPRQKKFEEIDGIRVHRVMVPYNLFMLYNLFKLNYQAGIDIIHAHATSGFTYAVLKNFLYDKWAKSFIAHVHGTTKGIRWAWSKVAPDALSEETIKRRAERQASILRETIMWKNADALIAHSEFLREELVDLYGISRKNVFIVPNGVDLHTFYPRKSRETILKSVGLDSRSHIVLYLGGFRPVKGPLYIAKALEKIHDTFENVKVLFVGGKHSLDETYEKSAMKLVKNLQEKGAMRIFRNIPHIRLPHYYSAADAVVLPSIYEGFPKVILEAMACGTPIIASAVGAIPEVIRNGETGILVEPANSDELADAIITMVSNPELRKKLGSKGRILVEENFTWEHAAKRTLAIYEKLLSL